MPSEQMNFPMRSGRPSERQLILAPNFYILAPVFAAQAAKPVARDEPRTEQEDDNPRFQLRNEVHPSTWRATGRADGSQESTAAAIDRLARWGKVNLEQSGDQDHENGDQP